MTEETSGLAATERWLQAVITNPAGVVAGLASEEARRNIDVAPEEIETIVTRSRKLTATERLAIYGHAYFARLQECLRAEFPVLLHALGEELFDLFTFEYLKLYPSRSYTLNQLGQDFPRFLAKTRPDHDALPDARESWPDFIIDLATLERAFSEVFDGPGTEGGQILAANDLSAIEGISEARFLPVVCLKVMSFRYPVSEYFTAVRKRDTPSLPEPADTYLAMTRRSYTVVIHQLTPHQYALLTGLVAGQTLNECVSALAKVGGDDFQPLMSEALTWSKNWSAKGFFAGIETQKLTAPQFLPTTSLL